jgi:hypothetical protein
VPRNPIEITIHGDEAAERQVQRLALFLTDLRPFWPRVARLFRGWMRFQFASEGAFWSVGGRWAPLNPDYAKRKRILWGERPILVASGQARRAADNPRRIIGHRSLSLEIDDAGPEHEAILHWHQEGTPRMPKREVIGILLPPLARFELEREGEAYVRDALGRF